MKQQNFDEPLQRQIVEKSFAMLGKVAPEMLVDSLAAGTFALALRGLYLALEGFVSPEIAFHTILMAVSSALTIYIRPMALRLASGEKSEK